MSESESQQQTIFGEPLDEQVRIETTGRLIRPFKRMLDEIAAEYKLQFDSDGLTVSVVDSGNVIGIQSHLQADAFESYSIDGETTLGISSSHFGSAIQYARYGKRTDDSVTITANAEHVETETTRDIAGTEATIKERAELIDPNSIRQTPNTPDLDLAVEVDLSPEAFCETVGLLETDAKTHVKIGSGDDYVLFGQSTDLQDRSIRLDADPTEKSEETIFTSVYFEQIANALQNGYVDNLTLRWDEDMPIFAEFEREDVYTGVMFVAPRITGD